MEYITLQMGNEVRDIMRSPIVTTKHILRMPWISLTPGFVVEFIDEARAVVALVERGCY